MMKDAPINLGIIYLCLSGGFLCLSVCPPVEMAAALLALVAASWLPGPPGCPASPRRPSGVHTPQRFAFRMTSTPPREMDPRGFVVPQVGDV